ncbi:fimbria/pilus outer membrane usher protein [Escherichia coli]|uniref:fimbria/pilus outer membrane usher protein n=1 Tax=Escherichia coli TaxID=562 RepID=UPI000DEA9CD4|nr:fimbria/pilus outer membrane usher protein [Escherichia coli]RBQ41323.1 fimbrial biogenesis outer membrane usher protein [Escherichia coli]
MKTSIKKTLLLVKLAIFFSACGWGLEASASDKNQDFVFDPNFLKLSDGKAAKNIDLSYFSNASGAVPGSYYVDVIVNGELIDRQAKVDFVAQDNRLTAKLPINQLDRWGIDTGKLANSSLQEYFINKIAGATENFDIDKQKLVLTIPQSYLKPQDWLSTPPHIWDEGIPALMVNYLFNGTKQNNNGYRSRSQFLALDSSLNLGGWRLRQNGNWSTNSYHKGSHWQPVNVYLQHDYSFLQGGQFTVGQTSTDGNVFDSFPFEGVQVSSDNGMIAPELSQYSPVVRGIAYSQAQVTVRQGGIVIYQKNVPPGPFELRDFNQMLSGDLEVEIREADGSVRYYTQPSAVLPILQRQGRYRYNLAVGKYRSNSYAKNNSFNPQFIQSSIAVGLPNEYTLYGGGIQSDNYLSALLGIGKYSEFWGAFSADITYAKSRFLKNDNNLGTQKGQSFRFMYSRGFGETNTTLNITGYRYGARGYYDFNELQQIQSNYSTDNYHQRSRISAILNQEFQYVGQLNLLMSKDQYWDARDGYSISASYSLPFRNISAMISLGYNKNPYYHDADKSLYLSLSIPIKSLLNGQNMYLTTNTVTNNGQVQQQIGLNGSSRDGELSYSFAQGWQNQKRGETGNVNINYRGPYALMNGGYAWQKNNSQWNYGITGGIAIHQHGITLSQPLSLDSGNALVHARDAADVKVLNGSGIYTDWRGYAIVPYLTPYNRNQISLDVNSAKSNVELVDTDITVIPKRGALVSAPFKTNVGNKAIITLIQKNGKPVPFGSLVTIDSENSINSNIVADMGQVYMSGLPEEDTLVAKWGESPSQQCKASYKFEGKENQFTEFTVQCH